MKPRAYVYLGIFITFVFIFSVWFGYIVSRKDSNSDQDQQSGLLKQSSKEANGIPA